MSSRFDTAAVEYTLVASLPASANRLGLSVEVYHPTAKPFIADPNATPELNEYNRIQAEECARFYLGCALDADGREVAREMFDYMRQPLAFSEMIRRTLHSAMDGFDRDAIEHHVDTAF